MAMRLQTVLGVASLLVCVFLRFDGVEVARAAPAFAGATSAVDRFIRLDGEPIGTAIHHEAGADPDRVCVARLGESHFLSGR